MKHYVIVHNWANEYDSGSTILGVTHSMEEAKKIFNEKLAEEKEYAEENNFVIFDNWDTVFDAGEYGDYNSNHTYLFIEMV